jgi:ankyrin repeat protein
MNVQSSDGGTALMYATRNGCDSVVELLEKHGAH